MFSLFRLSKRVSELEDLMAKLARTVGDRELDWLDMRARCKRLLDRTEKAAARLDKGEAPVDEPASMMEPEAASLSGLTPAQRRMQEQVNLRRKLLGIKREAS